MAGDTTWYDMIRPPFRPTSQDTPILTSLWQAKFWRPSQAPCQSGVHTSGTWKGVALLSKHPIRRIPVSWPDQIAHSSRVLAAATCIDGLWIQIGVLYGEPESKLYPQYRDHNDCLLEAVATHLCGFCTGPRMVAGDFNVLPGSLPAFRILENAGFRDIQTIAHERWGIQPVPTSKGKTHKDYCWISPELQQLLTNVEIDSTAWPDHAVLQARFWHVARSLPRQVWNPPLKLDWPSSFEIPECAWTSLQGSMDSKYEQLWTLIETSAAKNMPVRPPVRAFGRGRVEYTKTIKGGFPAPMKASRPGDAIPFFHGLSRQHSLWFRQVRRLQSYVRHVSTPTRCGDQHAYALWTSILNARGFPPKFAHWWTHCQTRTPDAPVQCPVVPPSASCARGLFNSLLLEVRKLETSLRQQSGLYARCRRNKDPMLIFQDLKETTFHGADVFIRPVQATVSEFQLEDCRLVLQTSTPFDASVPIFCNGVELAVIHADHDCLWLDGFHDVPPGSTVSQTLYKADLDSLFDEFAQTWTARWDRHRNVPLGQWRQILSFARDKLPRHSFSWPALTVQTLESGIRSKKKKTSKGLDGVSTSDLLSMPSSVLSAFCDMFQEVESVGHWPTCLIDGRVAPLPKCHSPQGPGDFRPITIVGLLYRIWGSYHARRALAQLDEVLPDGLFGSRPKCFAAQMWMKLLIAIDQSYQQQQPLCGVVLDLQKAFNTLPRSVVTETLAWLGLPQNVLVGWTAAISQMARRFQIRGAIGPKLWSSSGYAEGDAMSCIAMIAIDAIFHAWVSFQCPTALPLSYVDDWQVMLPRADDMPALVDKIMDLARLLDVSVDLGKTYTWATGSFARKFLKTQPIGVKLASRNLGAHVQMSKKHTNFILTQRIAQLKVLWPRLRLSASRYPVKLQAIRAAAWPRALHGIAATTLGTQCFKSLRAGALKGLKYDNAGCNAAIHLGLVEHPSTDPWYWAVLQTFRSVRDADVPTHFVDTFRLVANQQYKGPKNSISMTVVTRVQKLGWQLHLTGQVSDVIGSFSLFQIGFAELQFRMELAWTAVVAQQVTHRRGFTGLSHCDPIQTRRWVRNLQPTDAGAFKKLLNGTHMTRDAQAHCAPGSSNLCPWCQCTDSRYHRFWVCDHFADERSQVPPGVLAGIPALPDSLTCYGWSIRPATMFEWLRYHAQVSAPCPMSWDLPVDLPDHLQVFTDGTCYDQKQAQIRFGAWAVHVVSVDLHSSPIWTCAGPLPGILQSAYRSEVFAVGVALEFAKRCGRSLSLWCDCAAVVLFLSKLLQGSKVPHNHPHADLWNWISRLLHSVGHANVSVTKVGSHLHSVPVGSPLELWCSSCNDAVDEAAKEANRVRPASFWTLHSKHVQAVQLASEVSRHVQSVQLRISRRALDDLSVAKQVHDPPTVDPTVYAPQVPWAPLPELTHFPAQAVRWYGFTMTQLIMSWFWNVLADPGDAPMRWISHTQLYIDFQLATGNNGPVHHVKGTSGKWTNSADDPLTGLAPFGFKQRCRWFAKVMKESLRHFGLVLPAGFQKPWSFYLSLHCSCLGVPWPLDRLETVDRWLQSHLDAVAKRDGKQLDSLPLCAAGGLPEVVLADVRVA